MRERVLSLIVILLSVLLIVLFRRRIQAESVLSSVSGERILSKAKTITPDPETGLPRFHSDVPSTLPLRFAERILPLGSISQGPTNFPVDPLAKTACPAGYQIWKDIKDGKWWCIPQ